MNHLSITQSLINDNNEKIKKRIFLKILFYENKKYKRKLGNLNY